MTARELLLEPLEFLAPERALDGLSPDLADRRLEGANHSIAEIVAHLAFWQNWFYARCAGKAVPIVPRRPSGWPAVEQNSWPSIGSQFLERLEPAGVALGRRRLEARRAADRVSTARKLHGCEALVHVANHNGHHLGQVILLRQLLGAWPPPAGSWTW